jgi:hypothetical protein
MAPRHIAASDNRHIQDLLSRSSLAATSAENAGMGGDSSLLCLLVAGILALVRGAIRGDAALASIGGAVAVGAAGVALWRLRRRDT